MGSSRWVATPPAVSCASPGWVVTSGRLPRPRGPGGRPHALRRGPSGPFGGGASQARGPKQHRATGGARRQICLLYTSPSPRD
eukprot:13064444-Alexandrium_andersonii.AAC.1